MSEPTLPATGFRKDTSVQDWMTGLGSPDTPNEPAAPAQPQTPDPDIPDPDAGVEMPAAPGKEEPAAPAKPAAAKAQPKAEPKAEPAKGKEEWPRNKENWEKFVSLRDKGYQEREEKIAAIEKEREDLRKQIEEVRKHGPSPELEGLKKERDELSERLRIADVTSHPKFVAYFQNKTDAQLNLAKSIVGADKADRITSLLQTPASPIRDQQIEELVAELSPISQSRIGSVINQLAQIDAERAGEITKARESFATIQAQKEAEGKAIVQQAEQQFSDLVKQVQKDSFLFQEKAGDEAWNTGVKQRLEAARTLMFGNPGPDIMMKAALAAASLPAIIQHGQTMTAENEKLKKQVAELTAAQPKVATQQPPKTGTQPQRIPVTNTDPMAAVGAWMKINHAPVEE